MKKNKRHKKIKVKLILLGNSETDYGESMILFFKKDEDIFRYIYEYNVSKTVRDRKIYDFNILN